MALTESEELELLELENENASATKSDPPGKLSSFAQGGAQGLSLGFADELEGLIRAAGDDTYKEGRDKARTRYHEAEKANPKTYMGGQFAGAVAPVIAAEFGSAGTATPVVGTRLATMMAPSTAKGMMALGAAQGLGDSEKEDVMGNLWQMMKGAAIGKVAHTAGKVLSPIARTAADEVAAGATSLKEGLEDTAGYAAGKATGMTKALRKKFGPAKALQAGKTLMEGAEGAPGVVSLGADTADMTARAAALKKTAGDRIGSIMSDLDESKLHKPIVGRMVEELKAPIAGIKGVKAAAPLAGQYRKGIADLQTFGKKPSFERLQQLKKIYGDLAFPGGKGNAEGVQGYKDIYFAIKRELERSTDEGVQKLAAAIPKTVAPMETFGERSATERAVKSVPDIYRGAKEQYGAAKMALEGLRDKSAAEMGNKFFGLTDTILGSGGMTAALATQNLPTAAATIGIVGAKKFMEKQGPQTIAVASSKLASRIQTNPQVYGKYAEILVKAAQRGGQSLSATNFILQQRDPEYRKLNEQLDKEDGQ